MEIKVKGVVDLRSCLFIVSLFCCTVCFAQEDEKRFIGSFLKNFHYPEELRSSCIPTMTNLIVQVNKDGTIGDMMLSDSADPLFRVEFTRMKHQLDSAALKRIAYNRKLKGQAFLVPVFYLFETEYCPNSLSSSKLGIDTYSTYRSIPYNGLVYALPPVINLIYRPLH